MRSPNSLNNPKQSLFLSGLLPSIITSVLIPFLFMEATGKSIIDYINAAFEVLKENNDGNTLKGKRD